MHIMDSKSTKDFEELNIKSEERQKEHQKMLFSMLCDIDALCRKYNIPYMLFSGTALGAVRHKGFIPWDDDLDILLLRPDYERLLCVAEAELDRDTYFVQREFSKHWPMQFSKLRLNGTTCMEKYHPRDKKVHQGVYIDIFPCDNLADNALVRKLQFAASKVIIAKSLYARGYETKSLAKKAFMQLCRVIPRVPLYRFCIRKKDAASKMVHSFFAAARKYGKNIYPREWMTELKELPFESGAFPVSAHYDELLKKLYGDYTVLPKPEERVCKQHAAILDLNRPYTEYIEAQSEMIFDNYTRSIR